MKTKLFNYFIIILLLFEIIVIILAIYIDGWESKNVGIGLLLALITGIFIPTKKGVGQKYF